MKQVEYVKKAHLFHDACLVFGIFLINDWENNQNVIKTLTKTKLPDSWFSDVELRSILTLDL
ncbi:hypothetical protein D5R40_10865 [Okeania hirsuta]|uniref:Uncharacterized protein n=1 Tax=Okeania hirsuta TaxID=1458930 RepID=A0A3N6PWE3_9CYAN|nr:hypothetical protein [Okeania sp. SIO1F9]RQH45428.1 hypothetical protein D5R40_10865 [Okeania hirsuta]